MRHNDAVRGIAGLVLATAALLAPPGAAGQEPEPPEGAARADSLEARVARLEALLDSLRADLARALEEGAQEVPGGPGGEDELAALREAARRAAENIPGRVPADTPGTGASRTRDLQILNPEISVTGDIVGSLAAPAGGGEEVSAVPREFEFSFQAALDPYTRTKIFVTRHEDFEIAGLGHGHEEGEEEAEGEEAHEESGFEIEEGYLYWVGLPGGVGLKLGKFRQEIGLYNRWHTHALLEVDRPLPTVEFLGEDGLIQTGASLALPSFRTGPATTHVWFEATRAGNVTLFGEEGDLSWLGRAQGFFDLGPTAFLQLGATGLAGGGEVEGADLDSRVLALDLYLRWTPNVLYRDFSLKGEWYLAERESGGETLTGDGGYLQANAKLTRRWTLGLRGDWLDPFGDEPDVFQLVPSLTWWQSEWVRLRLQYHMVKPEGTGTNHTLLFQTVWAVGPHKHEAY